MLFTVIAIVVVLACTYKARMVSKEFAIEAWGVLKSLYTKEAWVEVKEGAATAWADTKKALQGLVSPLKWVGLILATYVLFIPAVVLILLLLLVIVPFQNR